MKKLSPLQVAQKWSQASGDKVSLRWAKGQEARKAAQPGKSISMTRIDRNPVGVTRTKIDRFAKGDGMSVSAFGVDHGEIAKSDDYGKYVPKGSKREQMFRPKGERRAILTSPGYLGGVGTAAVGAGVGLHGLSRGKTKQMLGGMALEGAGLVGATVGSHKAANKWRKSKGVGERNFMTGRIKKPA